MTDDRLKIGLITGLVSGGVLFTAGMQASEGGHIWPIHHGLVGALAATVGLAMRDEMYTPILFFSGVGLMLSDIQDVTEWFTLGNPQQPSDSTKSY
jgi:hypothetical protein